MQISKLLPTIFATAAMKDRTLQPLSGACMHSKQQPCFARYTTAHIASVQYPNSIIEDWS